MSSKAVKSCLIFDDRPSTPPEIRKYRRSTNLEPGHRFQHHGLADDYGSMNLDNKVYGITERADRTGASELINQPKLTEIQRINMIKAERVYKNANREPLGHSPDRKVQLPSKFTEEKMPFGVKSVSSLEPAKDLIFPTITEDSLRGEELYKRSHGSYGPGEQRSREYNWNIDPNQTRFGRKGDTIAMNGVSTNINDVLKGSSLNNKESVVNLKKVEDFRNMGDIMGQSKNLGQDSHLRSSAMVYGKPSGTKLFSAADVIKGRYKPQDNVPDRDLGKSVTPGFRNTTTEGRAYGCPSVRSDIPAVDIARRSLADSQNYGDDATAQDLINPKPFSDLSIGPLAMDEPRSKDKLLSLFARIGHILSRDEGDYIFDLAARGADKASVNEFRNALNDYLISLELDGMSSRR